MNMTTEQIARLAEACGIRRTGRTDEQVFEACLRFIYANMGSPA
jgi:hypothetical protein